MERIVDLTDYISGQPLIDDLANPWVQASLLAIFIITILSKWKAVFTVLLMLTFTIIVIRVGFGGGSTGVVEQAPVFLSGLSVVIGIAVYLFYIRR